MANYCDIWGKPIFVMDDGTEYMFEGLQDDEIEHRGRNFEFRFIVNTLRHYFGDHLDFDVNENQFKILKLSNDQMNILREISEDTCEFPVKYGRAKLRFEIVTYRYDASHAAYAYTLPSPSAYTLPSAIIYGSMITCG